MTVWLKVSNSVLSGNALAWENSQHLATLPLVSLPNDVWETSAEIPYWWHVTTQMWVVFLIGWIKFPWWYGQSKALVPRSCSDASSVWNFCAYFSDVIWQGTHGCRKASATGAIAGYFVVFAGCKLFEKSEKWTIKKQLFSRKYTM